MKGAAEEKKDEVKEQEQYIEEVIGYSMEDYFANKNMKGKKQGRAAEGFKLEKGAKFKVDQVDHSSLKTH